MSPRRKGAGDELLLDIAVAAAQAGGEVILKAHGARSPGALTPSTAKGVNDYVTEVDREAESRIVSIIKEVYPDHDIQAEETPESAYTSEYRWIIDPLDGTTNFIHGYPMFAVSVGLSHRNRMRLGVVFDPLRSELFRAEAGAGAYLNDAPLRLGEQRRLREALLVTGFPFKAQHHLHKYLQIFEELFKASSGIRRAGSASLDLAYVAAGRADGFFEMVLSPWDMAAGAVLVLEAGGVVCDFEGGEDYMGTGNIVAGHSSVVEEMLPRIARHFPLW
ncbi:MAG TPA: inositol monophosphatase family protein [Candidatus Polarisedimenticolia bacterium]|nr:inositol monophosphatase family protein [Candidatus Polarisedimenticolia bacterium]